MKKKLAVKAISSVLAGTMVLSLGGCGSSGSSSTATTQSAAAETTAAEAEADDAAATEEAKAPEGSIELAYNLTTDDYAVFQQIIADFTEETDIQVTVNNLGSDYESAMKTKMASNDLPDMWVTHGWSLIRYSEYMMDISDQPWVEKIDSGLKDVITNDDGELFILPITQAVASIMYNKDVVDAAGVEIADIRTWDDFNDACQKIADSGKTPIEMVLTDAYDSYTLEGLWPTEYTNDGVADAEANRESLKDGSWDWTQHTEAFDLIQTWYENGWINDDYVSGKRDQVLQALANGDGAFTLFSTENIPQIRILNKDANIGILPYPSVAEDAPSYFGTGEGNFSCFGIWKDTEYADECKQLLAYLAQPEIASQIVMIDGGIPALTDTEVESGTDAAYTADAFKEAQTQFDGDLFYDNFFDREYLPSGMWSVMTDSVDTFLADGDPASAKEEAVGIVADNYNDLMGN
ncbi:ABC transporter substrate-binding protein [Lachnoclostridium sp. Marseille-P6806]|uniref:ABC transporter substrate-binding protein n=1 Tax=Lachnoclostridium sp. Marseille-P6806 TaxID=2364793 RepID=UPI0010306508|nr:extracellular solute-binding protein [Lachnoclostridium sp. Marseille-P6806]